ncbi:MAG: pantoate--beta-alanine ligase [Vicingaceae bacterium]|nr:pantoate--beta-alanine ligase [Vicingaceae bacterium]
MLVVNTIEELQLFFEQQKGKSIGFVPTMGALHKGHVSLVEFSQQKCDITVCSIFVNPIQFNKQDDFTNYPKTLESDLKHLEAAKCDVVFCPSAQEMYPNKIEKDFDFGILSSVMEGEHRPGHFNGVAIVIERFFEIINPDFAFFGEKDFQQLAVVKEVAKQTGFNTKVMGAPTVREASGLAMSSRNLRLSEDEKIAAANISSELKYITLNKTAFNPQELKANYRDKIDANPFLKTEYIEIADGNTLLPVINWEDSDYPIAFTAVNVGEVRLIDNMTIIN